MKCSLTFLLLLAVAIASGCSDSDSALKSRFEMKRTAFEQLVQEAEALPTAGKIEKAMCASAGISARDFYCWKREDGTILFLRSFTFSYKGIAYVPEKSLKYYEVLALSTNEWPQKSGEFVKPLGENWYLFKGIY